MAFESPACARSRSAAAKPGRDDAARLRPTGCRAISAKARRNVAWRGPDRSASMRPNAAGISETEARPKPICAESRFPEGRASSSTAPGQATDSAAEARTEPGPAVAGQGSIVQGRGRSRRARASTSTSRATTRRERRAPRTSGPSSTSPGREASLPFSRLVAPAQAGRPQGMAGFSTASPSRAATSHKSASAQTNFQASGAKRETSRQPASCVAS